MVMRDSILKSLRSLALHRRYCNQERAFVCVLVDLSAQPDENPSAGLTRRERNQMRQHDCRTFAGDETLMSDKKNSDPTEQPGDSTSPGASLDFPADWKLETGVYSRDVNTKKLKKLDVGDMSIAESAIRKLPGRSFNPYDNSTQSSHPDPYGRPHRQVSNWNAASAPSVSPAVKPGRPAPPAAAPRTSALEKLGSWFKGKRKSDDDYE